jgi:serine/threonine protein phosphatase 1
MRLFSRRRATLSDFNAPLEPETSFYAIGDVHGCDTLLGRLLDKLAEAAHPEAKLVCLGDYVDRGEQSAQVLHRLNRLFVEASGRMICLKGNHEQMMLDFLDHPEDFGSRWLRHGGLQTMASFGLPFVRQGATQAELIESRDRLRERLGPELEIWLRELPLWWATGNIFVVHAAADPMLPVMGQAPQTMLWGHPDFERMPRQDDIWVVHGHTIVEEAAPNQGRIPVDTGAYATGRLSAVLVEPGKLTVIES